MAKLSAHGTEVYRLEKAAPSARYVISIRSDRWVMSKLHVLIDSVGVWHDYGWKRKGRAKPDVTLEELRDAYIRRGYLCSSGGTLPAWMRTS